MALIPGTRLGVYEITAKIGEGGMGQVYRGTDTILGRQVAIKILPEAFAADPERVARFDREAKTLASLNHPNIAAIYSVEQSAGHQALVMEFVEGDDLSQRIARGAIPLDEALSIAKQIAEGLEAAHERGIIHRDLKPANIKLRPDGVVKVLDLGLAKAVTDDGSGQSTESPTLTAIGTRAGMIIGTAAYMSPEQARGRPVDKRTDVWAFGCVLYEMLSGKRAFERDTISDTLAAVLSSDPDWTTIGPDVPAPVRLLLQQCLDKDRKRRISDISTALFVMSEPRMVAPTSVTTPAAARTRRLRVWPLVAAVAATALVVGAGSAVWFQSRSVPGRVARFTVEPAGAFALSVTGTDVAISPDGSQIVYQGNQGTQFFRRAVDALEPVALTGLDHPRMPFFKPDGQWVGFVAQFLLKKVPITGGPSETLLAVGARNMLGATWGENGTIIFATSEASTGLEQIADSGGVTTVLTRPDREQGETDHLWPVFLPGGQAVLFTITGRDRIDDAAVAVLDLRTRKYKRLVTGGSHARYVSSGHLVYGSAGTLRAVAFDLDRLEVVGTPILVLPQLVTTAQGAADFDVASDGTLVYVPTGLASATRTLVWVDRQAREELLGTPPRGYQYVRLSPDGRRVALDIRDYEDDISIWEIADRKLTRLTFDRGRDRFPVWTPNGMHILFGTERAGSPNVFSQASDGTGVAVQLTYSAAGDHVPMSVSPDGAWAVIRTGTPHSLDLSMVSLSKDHRVERLLNTPASEQNGEVSPDGHWLAYQSNESKSGQFEIYVRPFPKVNGGFWQVSTGGGTQPLWAPGGGELFYRSLTGAVMSVKVNPGPRWSASPPEKLFDGGAYSLGAPGHGRIGEEAFGRSYDYDSERRRFLMVRTPESPESSPRPRFEVVQNWFEELQRLIPPK